MAGLVYSDQQMVSSKPISTKLDWIGGYHLTVVFLPGFHPDVHSFAFDPNNPNAMWWGHDGGLSYTDNITTNNYASYLPWFDKNNGYNVTQFYMVAIPNEASDNRILGGTQDNGTPYFRFNGTTTTKSEDLSGVMEVMVIGEIIFAMFLSRTEWY